MYVWMRWANVPDARGSDPDFIAADPSTMVIEPSSCDAADLELCLRGPSGRT